MANLFYDFNCTACCCCCCCFLLVVVFFLFLLIVALVFYAFDLTPTRASVFLAIDLRRKMSKVINFYARFIYESEKEKYKNNKKK